MTKEIPKFNLSEDEYLALIKFKKIYLRVIRVVKKETNLNDSPLIANSIIKANHCQYGLCLLIDKLYENGEISQYVWSDLNNSDWLPYFKWKQIPYTAYWGDTPNDFGTVEGKIVALRLRVNIINKILRNRNE